MADDQRVAAIVARRYLRTVERSEDGVFTAWIVEMPNVVSEGDTADEALENLEEAFAGVVHVMIDEGREIPEPFIEREYSGRLQLRIPPSLHRRVAERADAERVSINRILSDAVARYVGAAGISSAGTAVASGKRDAASARTGKPPAAAAKPPARKAKTP